MKITIGSFALFFLVRHRRNDRRFMAILPETRQSVVFRAGSLKEAKIKAGKMMEDGITFIVVPIPPPDMV